MSSGRTSRGAQPSGKNSSERQISVLTLKPPGSGLAVGWGRGLGGSLHGRPVTGACI